MEDQIEPATTAGPDPATGSRPDADPESAAAARATGMSWRAGNDVPAAESSPDQSRPDQSRPDPAVTPWAATPEAKAFSRRVAAARERVADFDAVALNPDLPVTTAMAATIALSDRGPEIAYHLGCNRVLAERIAGLDPLSAARELGHIEAQLTAPPKRAVTAAPPPLRSLGAGETPRRDPDAMSYQEYKAWRRIG